MFLNVSSPAFTVKELENRAHKFRLNGSRNSVYQIVTFNACFIKHRFIDIITSIVYTLVLCFGADFILCCLNLMYVFIVLVKFGVAAYWEITAHSAYNTLVVAIANL